MTIEAHNTHDWPMSRLAPYGPPVTAALHKLADRFPDDVSIPGLLDEIMAGRRILWLLLDGDQFVSFVLTEMKENEMTGHRIGVLTDLAGDAGLALVPLLDRFEDWAVENGADEFAIIGRLGWKKVLAAQGYGSAVVTYRKKIEG